MKQLIFALTVPLVAACSGSSSNDDDASAIDAAAAASLTFTELQAASIGVEDALFENARTDGEADLTPDLGDVAYAGYIVVADEADATGSFVAMGAFSADVSFDDGQITNASAQNFFELEDFPEVANIDSAVSLGAVEGELSFDLALTGNNAGDADDILGTVSGTVSNLQGGAGASFAGDAVSGNFYGASAESLYLTTSSANNEPGLAVVGQKQ